MKFYSIILIIIACLFNSCKKDIVDFPSIQTKSISIVSSTSLDVTFDIKSIGSSAILDYGVIYSSGYGSEDELGSKVSFGNKPSKGEFTQRIDNIFVNSNYNDMIFVKTYITDTKGTVYGNTLNIQLPRPSTSSIIPQKGMSGDVVKILGNFSGPTMENTKVYFRTVEAKIISATNKEITVQVPSGIVAPHESQVEVVVKIGDLTSYANSSFVILANFKDFKPKSGVIGTNITFEGDNLPTNYYYSNPIKVFLDNNLISSNYYSSLSIPFSAKAESTIAIEINGSKKEMGKFTVTQASNIKINPIEVFPGENVVITGDNFPINNTGSYGNAQIKIGNYKELNLSYNSNNSFYLNMPESVEPGSYNVSLILGPHETKVTSLLKVKEHEITSISPTIGGAGTEVILTGKFKQGQFYYVYFDAFFTYVQALSSTQLKVIVPEGVKAGNVKLSFTIYGKKYTAPVDFQVVGPTFTSFSPTSGVAGTIITIKGENFRKNNSTVIFGTTAVQPIEVSTNTIKVAVPSNVLPGAMKIGVSYSGQTIYHDLNFTILN